MSTNYLTTDFRSPAAIGSLTTTGVTEWVRVGWVPNVFFATLSDTTTPSATCKFEYSQDGVNVCHIDAANLSLSGALDGRAVVALNPWTPFRWVRGRCSAIAGTDAVVTFHQGIA